jgi:hypothetical protein
MIKLIFITNFLYCLDVFVENSRQIQIHKAQFSRKFWKPKNRTGPLFVAGFRLWIFRIAYLTVAKHITLSQLELKSEMSENSETNVKYTADRAR